MQLITITAILVAACGVLFALQNHVTVAVTFLLWDFSASLALVLLLTLAVGGFIVAMVSTPGVLRRQWAIARQSKRISELEILSGKQQETIVALRGGLPLAEQPPALSRSYVGLKQIVDIIGGGEQRDSSRADWRPGTR